MRTSVIEEGDRISARFTNGTFSRLSPNSTAAQMRSIDISRVKDGKLIEHWDEFNLLEVFQQIGTATVRKAAGQMNHGCGCYLQLGF
jgi:predicted SnoaL-like aldol condensation-catalyzing enzyme